MIYRDVDANANCCENNPLQRFDPEKNWPLINTSCTILGNGQQETPSATRVRTIRVV